MKKNRMKGLVEEGSPAVVVVLTPQGLERSLIFYPQDDAAALEAGNLLLGKISPLLAMLDNFLRGDGEPK